MVQESAGVEQQRGSVLIGESFHSPDEDDVVAAVDRRCLAALEAGERAPEDGHLAKPWLKFVSQSRELVIRRSREVHCERMLVFGQHVDREVLGR